MLIKIKIKIATSVLSKKFNTNVAIFKLLSNLGNLSQTNDIFLRIFRKYH